MKKFFFKFIYALGEAVKHRINKWFSNSTSGYPHKSERREWNRYLYTQVHQLYSQQTKGRNHSNVHLGWRDKQNGVHTDNGIYFSLKIKGNSDTCYNTDEPSRCYTKFEDWSSGAFKWPQPFTDCNHLQDPKSNTAPLSSIKPRNCER